MSARISSADAELIHSLESAFAKHAGRDGLIELPELQRVLGLKNEHVALRVLRAFDSGALPPDREASGLIDSHAFVNAVRALISGGERERLEFAFRLYADDADGFISEPELLRMIAISAAESAKDVRASQPSDQLAKSLFRAADGDRDGRLSFEEFAGAMRRHPELLRRITRSEALGIAPNEALLQRLAAPPQQSLTDAPPSLLRVFDNHRYDLLALAAWLAMNLLVFSYTLAPAARDVPGSGWARLAHAFAGCLSLNAAFVFLPLMRHVVAHLRQTWWGQRLDIDRASHAHRVLGHVILGLAWAHAIAYALAFESGHHALGVGHLLTRTYPGGSGVLLLLAFTALWSLALVQARRAQRLDIDNTYRLYAGMLALIVVHAPSFLVWVALPVIGLVFELLSRRRKRSRQALVQELTALRAGVTRLIIERPAAFRFEAGNYVFVNLPNIAKHVWHPFTVSSPPEQSDLTLHAQNRDEWTTVLRAAAEARAKRAYKSSLLVHIDGPHGASSARIFHARNVVLIGAGAGITPLASVLGSIVARTSKRVLSSADCELQNVELFWLNRDQYAYEWFSSQLAELAQQPVQIHIGVHGCVTGGGIGSTSAALEIARQLERRDVRAREIGLRATTHAGHPDWRIVLTAIADQHAPEPVEVFFCGPPGLGAKLRDHCARIGMRFHEEKF